MDDFEISRNSAFVERQTLFLDEEMGENAWKPVVRLFRNESKDWTGVTVNGLEIVSTPGHKYFLPETKKWVSAENLKVGVKVLLSNGSYAIIEAVRDIHYDKPQTTYNFEVQGFHTYYVGNGVLVHNKGCGNNIVEETISDVKEWLGDDATVITNESGDKVFISREGTRKVRFDLKNPKPHENPHVHVEYLKGNRWRKSGPLWPKDVIPK